MVKAIVNFIISLLCFMVINASYAKEIVLNTEISPPYQIMIGGELSGVSVKTLGCIFSRINQDYKIKVVPWIRAQINVQTGKTQGFFTAMSFAQADKYATLSAPMALEKWYFYFKDKTLGQNKDFKQGVKIGAIRGSNQSAWLKINGYSIVQEVPKYQQLIKLLDSGRIDAFLADQRTFEKEISILNLKGDQFYSVFIKYTPLGIYFSKSFLKSRQGFLEAFNENVFICAPETLELSIQEVQKLHMLTINKIMKWMNNPIINSMVKSQNDKHQYLTRSEITALDKQWRKEVKSSSRPMIDQILANPLSQYLAEIKKEAGGLYSELFVMDNRGLIVGQSDKTSDYWQGDEAKFKQTFETGKDAVFIDTIEYDESSRVFQIQVSLTINDVVSETPIGALTVGVDLEKALTSE